MDELLTPGDVATYLRVTQDAVLTLWRAGRLRGVRLGYRTIRFTTAAVTDLVLSLEHAEKADESERRGVGLSRRRTEPPAAVVRERGRRMAARRHAAPKGPLREHADRGDGAPR